MRIINQPLQNRKTSNMTEKQLHLFKRNRNQIQMKLSERTRNGWDGKKCVCCTCPALKQNPLWPEEFHPQGAARQRMGGMSGRCHQHSAQAKRRGKPVAIVIIVCSRKKLQAKKVNEFQQNIRTVSRRYTGCNGSANLLLLKIHSPN